MIRHPEAMQSGLILERNRKKLCATGVLLKLSTRSLQLTKIGDKTLELPSIELCKIWHLRLWLE